MKTPLETFTCWECGNCCRIEGYVELTGEDISRLAKHVALTEVAFVEAYTQLAADRKGLALRMRTPAELANPPWRGLRMRAKEADACVFLADHGACGVYDARPQQCRDFPYTWNHPGWEKQCENACQLAPSAPAKQDGSRRAMPGQAAKR